MGWLAAILKILASAWTQIVAAAAQQKKNDAIARQQAKDKEAESDFDDMPPPSAPAV